MMGNSPQPGTFLGLLLIHNLLELVIGTMKAEGREGDRARGSRVSHGERERGNPEVGPGVIRRRTAVLNQTHSNTHLRYAV